MEKSHKGWCGNVDVFESKIIDKEEVQGEIRYNEDKVIKGDAENVEEV